jgi:dTDP-4-dehydrorhamnose reductase
LNMGSPVALITGGSGSLGWVLARRLALRMDVIATYHSHASQPEGTKATRLELERPAGIKPLLDRYHPQIIFHLAAITNPDQCERAPAVARKVNLEATLKVAEWAGTSGAKLVFVSTDLVFDGDKGNYSEEDDPHPLSVYGRTKLDAELAVLEACPAAVVLRGSLFFGLGGPGRTFLATLLESLSQGRPMHLFTDQKRTPVLLEDMAFAMTRAVDLDLTGLFHAAGGEVFTRYEFGKAVCEAFGFDRSLLIPIRMADFQYQAPRPLDCSLDISKIRKVMGFEPTPVARALAEIASR